MWSSRCVPVVFVPLLDGMVNNVNLTLIHGKSG
jgi:hypothetical protein